MTVTLTNTPTLRTERLTLRAPQPADAEAFIAFYQTDRARYVAGPMTKRQAWYFFCTDMGHWVMHGFGMFVVTYRDDPAPLGIVGHWYPNTWPEKEIGWILFDPAHEGKGIACEAAEACIEHAWHVLRWPTIVSYVDPDNTASIALAERLGAALDPDAAPLPVDKPVLTYRHPKP